MKSPFLPTTMLTWRPNICSLSINDRKRPTIAMREYVLEQALETLINLSIYIVG